MGAQRLEAELASQKSAGPMSSGKTNELEEEIAKLRAQLDAQGNACTGIVPPPEEYEAMPCFKYSCGCVWFFTVMFVTFVLKWIGITARFIWKWIVIFAEWAWKWTCCFATWLSSKVETATQGASQDPKKPPPAAVVPESP